MKRSVRSAAQSKRREESAEPRAIVTRGPYLIAFAIAGIYLYSRYLLTQPEAGLLSSIGQAFVVVFVCIVLMLFNRTIYFWLGLGFLGYWLAGSNGFPLFSSGALLWILGGTASFFITLSIYAGYVSPPINQHISRTSYVNFILMFEYLKREWVVEFRKPRHAPGVAHSFTKLRAGEVPRDRAYAVFRGFRYISSVGPGLVLLQRRQRIAEVYDTRPQSRAKKFIATTLDGIEIDSHLRVGFRVKQPADSDDRIQYPYSNEGIRELWYANTVTQAHPQDRERTIHPFSQVIQRAMIFFKERVASQTLDDLLKINDAEAQPLKDIASTIQEELVEYFDKRGLEIQSVTVYPLVLPAAAQKARLGAWKRSWDFKMKQRGMGRGIRRISPAQAKEQFKVIEDVMHNLELLASAESNVPMQDEIVEKVRAVISDAATEGLIKMLIPDPKNG